MSDLDEYKRDRQKLIEARKIKNTVPDAELEAHSDADVRITPKTFKEKWANYWYHYKAMTFAIAIGAVLVFSLVWSLTHPTVYDASISFVSTVPFDSISESLQTSLEPYIEDFSGDGTKKLELAFYTMSDPNSTEVVVNGQAEMATQMKLMARLTVGEDFIFILDDVGYEKMTQQMEIKMENLSKYTDSPQVNGDKYKLNGTKLLEKMGMKGWEDNLYLCFVDFSAYGEREQMKDELVENHAHSLEVLEKLLSVG